MSNFKRLFVNGSGAVLLISRIKRESKISDIALMSYIKESRILAAFLVLSLTGATLTAVLPQDLHAQSPVTVSAQAEFKTKYLFAGIPFAADEVTQAKVTIGRGAFTLNGFSVYDHDASDVTEGDVYGDYYTQLSPRVGAFVGAAVYNFKIADEWELTPEVYAGLVLSAPLNPTLYFAHDFDLGDGNHFMLTLSHEIPLGIGGATLSLAGNIDYNNDYYRDGSDFSFADVVVYLGIPVGPLTVSPMFQLQRGIDDDFTDEEVFGIKASMVF